LVNLKQSFELVYPEYSSHTETVKIDVEREEFLNKLKTLRKKMNSKNTVIIGVLGESPYAEFAGDVNIPYCNKETVLGKEGCLYDDMDNAYLPDNQRTTLKLEFDKFDTNVIDRVREEDKNIPLITVLLSGRPSIIDEVLEESNAVISAFLPGTSGGQGIVDAITGAYVMRPNGADDKVNSLSFDWPKNMDQLKDFPIYKADGSVPKIEDPLFKVGYGLSSFSGEQGK